MSQARLIHLNFSRLRPGIHLNDFFLASAVVRLLLSEDTTQRNIIDDLTSILSPSPPPLLPIMSEKNESSEKKESPQGKDEPAGGHDKTPLKPTPGDTYTVKITIHSALNLPVSDFPGMSSDPYILSQMNVPLTPRHKEDPRLRFRSNTLRKTLEPEWNAEWVVAGVPASGFKLKTRIYDEDPGNHDDRLGRVTFSTGPISEGWKMDHHEHKVKRAGASVRAYGLRWLKTATCSGAHAHARLVVSVEVLEKTEREKEVGMAYTINNFWWIHYSPLIGKLVAGTKAKDDKGIERSKWVHDRPAVLFRAHEPDELTSASKPTRCSCAVRSRQNCTTGMSTSSRSSRACSPERGLEVDSSIKHCTTNTSGSTFLTKRQSTADSMDRAGI